MSPSVRVLDTLTIRYDRSQAEAFPLNSTAFVFELFYTKLLLS